MSNIFESFLNDGRAAARNVLKNRQDVEEIFEQLKLAIDSITGNSGELRSTIEFVDIFKSNPSGYKRLTYVIPEINKQLFIFKFKQDDLGLPIIIDYNDKSIICVTKDELFACIASILSEGQLVLSIEGFTSQL